MPFDLFDTSASYDLLRQDGLTVSLTKALRTKRYVMLYIASQWWAPCRGVTAQLQSFYKAHHDSHAFEVIFLSTDRSKESMLSCFHSAHGDWLCLDYEDARRLEAELAADADLHPKQVPACLVFELTHPRQPSADAVSARPSAAVDSAEPGHLEGAPFVSCAADACGETTAAAAASFARLVTKHGREMLSKDKEAALFPWHDDGWSDAESVRSAVLTALPQSQEGLTPEKTAAPPLQTSSPTPSAPPKEASGDACEQREESSAPPPPPPPRPTSAPSHESEKGDTNSVPTVPSSPTTPHLILHHRPNHIGGRPRALNGAAGAAGKDVVEGPHHHHPDSAGARSGVILIRRTQAPSPVAQAVVTAEVASADN